MVEVAVKVKVTMVEADGPELAEVEGGVEVEGRMEVEGGVEVEGGAEVEGGVKVEGEVEDNRGIKVVLAVTVTYSQGTAGA